MGIPRTGREFVHLSWDFFVGSLLTPRIVSRLGGVPSLFLPAFFTACGNGLTTAASIPEAPTMVQTGQCRVRPPMRHWFDARRGETAGQ
jgi:hypothetical protein